MDTIGARLPSFMGIINLLFFTHNTMVAVLYSMVNSPDAHFIRSTDQYGNLISRGAQFRYGVDSQYGGVVFVMKNNFWKGLKGAHNHGREITERAYIGHFYKRDFVQYSGEANQFLIDRWLELEAQSYDFRPQTSQLNGKECKQRRWNVSWCNMQIHLGENVDFDNVEKVYVPAWLLHDTTIMAGIAGRGINTTLLTHLITNKLPYFPGNITTRNPLNGLFYLYGPPLANDHYHNFEKDRGKFRAKSFADAFFADIVPSAAPHTVQTHRHSASSSTVSMSEVAFLDLQIKFMADLVAANFTLWPPEDAEKIRAFKLFD